MLVMDIARFQQSYGGFFSRAAARTARKVRLAEAMGTQNLRRDVAECKQELLEALAAEAGSSQGTQVMP